MSGIMFNEDCTHFAHNRYKNGINVGYKELQEFIDQYAGTQVKEFVMKVNAMLAFFPSKSRENILDKYCKYPEKYGPECNYVKTLVDIFKKQGLDMYGIWIDRLRMHGISPWLSIRMNDIHFGNAEDNFLFSEFFRDNRHLRRTSHRPRSNSLFDFALDYSFPEVREHNLSLIREVVERYDFEGLELDWMRESFSLGVGKECDGKDIITAFMQEVRSILDEAERVRGHRIKMGIRVPWSPEIALRFGLDTISWARCGLVDVIVPIARWESTDNDMPIDLWKQILSGSEVMLCAGVERNIGATRSSYILGMCNSMETYSGSAAAYLGMGADRIYLYNYFDDSGKDPSEYRALLMTIGELETVAGLPRRHVVTIHDITAPGTRVADMLPLRCNPPDANGTHDFHDIRIATGPVTPDTQVTLIIGVNNKEDLNASDFSVYLNGWLCMFEGDFLPPEPRPDCKLYSFCAACDDRFPAASIVEIASEKKPFTVEWLEIDLQ
ncbi:MAG: hypothetical protein FIA99_14365 [Ruminiclostridium sp.]|nr:hypothetical protein [Ruminiclostridium sp.]